MTLLLAATCVLGCADDTSSGGDDANNAANNNAANNNTANNNTANNNTANNNTANNNAANNNNPLPDAGGEEPDVALVEDVAVEPDAAVEDAAMMEEDAAAEPDVAMEDAATPQGSTLRGTVTRGVAPSTNPAGDARGDLYVAVLTADPIFDRANAQSVGQALIEGVDLSPQGASVTYVIQGVPPRPQPYWVATFLDDNGTATVDNPSPDRGDLLQLDGIAIPQVTINAPEVQWDVSLNAVLPF